MIVTCKQCFTKYYIGDEAIGKNGHKVKCTQCNYVWFQDYQKCEESDNDDKNTVANLPVVIQYVLPYWIKLVPVFFSALVLITALFVFQGPVVSKFHFMNVFYNKIGLPVTEGLILNGIEVKKKEDNTVDINGFITNKSTLRRSTPNLIIKFLSVNKKSIAVKTAYISSSYLGKDGRIAFYKNIEMPLDAKFVSVSIANKYDILSY